MQTKEEFYTVQNDNLAKRTEKQKQLDADAIHNMLRALQGKA